MQSIQKMGGIGAFIAAGTFVVGLAMFATMFGDFVSASDAAAAVEFIAENQVPLLLWNITISSVFGIDSTMPTPPWPGWPRCSGSSGRE